MVRARSTALTDPWYPLSVHYYTNGKVREAGFAGAMCHQYLIANARLTGTGVVAPDKWVAHSIRRWAGVAADHMGTVEEIERAMRLVEEIGLVDVVSEGGEVVGYTPHDLEDYLNAAQRTLMAANRLAERRAAEDADRKRSRSIAGDRTKRRSIAGDRPKSNKIKSNKIKEEGGAPSDGGEQPGDEPIDLSMLTARQRSAFDALCTQRFFVPGTGDTTYRDRYGGTATYSLAYTLAGDAFPSVDAVAQISRAAAWTQTNRSRAKIDLAKYLGNWFRRAQDAPNPPGASSPAHTTQLSDQLARRRR